jgi:glycosyltransferase involved in cell wall biosynthesis
MAFAPPQEVGQQRSALAMQFDVKPPGSGRVSIIASMSVSRIGLVHPPPASVHSGGDLYDQKLLQYAASCGFPLHSVPWHDDVFPAADWDLLVWDSLLLDRATRVAEERLALLLHYLPSLDPGLDARSRGALQNLERRALARADFVITTGRTLADAVLSSEPGKPVFVCEPGVEKAFQAMRRGEAGGADCPERPQRPDREDGAHRFVRLLTVAHLLPAKGHRHLLAVLAQLAHLPWHWHVVGDGHRSPETMRELHGSALRAGLANRLSFHGALTQEAVAELMADSDLLVFPSSFESYGMVLAESVAAGLPVLSNRVGAAEQLIRHGETGFLVTPGDWDGFGRYLRRLLVHAELRARFAENLRQVRVRGWDDTFADFRAACESRL